MADGPRGTLARNHAHVEVHHVQGSGVLDSHVAEKVGGDSSPRHCAAAAACAKSTIITTSSTFTARNNVQVDKLSHGSAVALSAAFFVLLFFLLLFEPAGKACSTPVVA